MNNERTKKALLIMNAYDSKAQKMKCCEELSELEAAILKHLNKGGNTDEIMEEMADAYIMLEQMKHMMPFGENTLEEMIDFKLDRQIERIKGKNEEKEPDKDTMEGLRYLMNKLVDGGCTCKQANAIMLVCMEVVRGTEMYREWEKGKKK